MYLFFAFCRCYCNLSNISYTLNIGLALTVFFSNNEVLPMARAPRKTSWISAVNNQVTRVKIDTLSMVKDMGFNHQACKSWRDVPHLLQNFSKKNKSPRAFFRNLDLATYDARERLKWNYKMEGHLACSRLKRR